MLAVFLHVANLYKLQLLGIYGNIDRSAWFVIDISLGTIGKMDAPSHWLLAVAVADELAITHTQADIHNGLKQPFSLLV